MTLFYKILKKIYPEYLYRFIHFAPDTGYSLRNSPSIIPRFSRLSLSLNSFFPSTSREWNQLPSRTQGAVSVNTFKALLRDRPINPYKKVCSGQKGTWLSRLRMGLSPLNHHRRAYNFIADPTCPACNSYPETTFHYFLKCPAYRLARIDFFNALEHDLGIDTQNSTKLLEVILYGKHISPNLHTPLYILVCKFMTETTRFI